MVLWKAAIEAGKIAYRFGKSAGKFTSGESTFIRRFPPHLRPYAKDVIQGGAIITHGGLIGDALNTFLNGLQAPYVPTSSNTQYKTYNRSPGRYGTKRKTTSNYRSSCGCPNSRHTNRCRNR